jgi:hypothetical protein
MTLAMVLGLVSMVQSALAFDGMRKGFLLGGGLGLGVDSFKQEITDGATVLIGDRTNQFSLGTDFKIGAGLSPQTFLYFHNQSAWFSLKNIFDNDVTVQSGVIGIGFTWFTSPEPRSFFITGTAGISYWDLPFESDAEAWTSGGAIVGVGYEFSPHWSVDASLLLGSPEKDEGGLNAKTKSTSLLVTVTGVAY